MVYDIKDLTFTYPNREAPALCGIDLSIKPGEFIVLCGPSGCGKTTLLRHLKPSATPHGMLGDRGQGTGDKGRENRGEKTSRIHFCGKPINELPERDAAAKIGFVMQSPENQIVTDKVWHELAFGLESLGLKTPEIRLRVAEMASFFGIQTWFHKSVADLSGGEKQMLALASIMVLQPTVLILDEPTSQLDPIAAGDFLATIGKINRELGLTIIMTEHRLEEVFPLSSRALVMDKGRIIADGSPRQVGLQLCGSSHGMFLAMPAAMRVWAAVAERNKELGVGSEELGVGSEECPITVREGADWLAMEIGRTSTLEAKNRNQKQENVEASKVLSPRESATRSTPHSTPHTPDPSQSAIEMSQVWFRYEKDLPDVVKGLSFKANFGEITTILGGNGTGKTTTLMLIAGLYKPYRGSIKTFEYRSETQSSGFAPESTNDGTEPIPGIAGKRRGAIPGVAGKQRSLVRGDVKTLPQNPQSLFTAKTVREDLLEILSESKLSKETKMQRLAAMVKLCRLDGLLDAHPYDLSGGEQQRAGLAKVLLLQPRILLLDEPTKGFDAEFKQVFAAILRKLAEAGAAVIIVSHDVEFCAEYSDRCALFFDGNIVTENRPREFFSGNSFYTTSANRMARTLLPEAITVKDIVSALGGELPSPPDVPDVDAKYEIKPAEDESSVTPQRSEILSIRQKIAAGAFAALLIAGTVFAGLNFDGFKAFISGGRDAMAVMGQGLALYVAIMISIAAGIAGIAFSLSYKRDTSGKRGGMPVAGGEGNENRTAGRKLSKRTIAAAAMILLAIPLTIYIGSYIFGDRKYYFISLLIILETMLPFALLFESRKPQARELVLLAVLCAIAVAGRAAFFMLPQFRPVVALVIIAGVAFGGEAGFLVGAMTGFVGNFFFGQGPWTPWQMFAFGLIGFLAGALSQKGLLRRNPASLAVFGAIATAVVYGGIMNPSFVMIYQLSPTREMFILAYLQGIPFDLVHAAATVTFLAILSRPMLQKLDRIKVKYGLVGQGDGSAVPH